jgi:hypothetical protein
MARRKTPEEWLAKAQQTLAQVGAFNRANPHATLRQMEDAVEVVLSQLRQELLSQSVAEHPLADFRRSGERPTCPHCGERLQAIGQDQREVTIRGGSQITLERTRGRCSGCGAELFPPG